VSLGDTLDRPRVVPGVGNAGLLSDVPAGHGGGFNGVEPALELPGGLSGEVVPFAVVLSGSFEARV